MADERDTLYGIENNLTIPFSLKNCSCSNMTEDKVDSLTSKIENLKNDLSSLKKEMQ